MTIPVTVSGGGQGISLKLAHVPYPTTTCPEVALLHVTLTSVIASVQAQDNGEESLGGKPPASE